MVLDLPFPMIDPVLVEIGPFAIRWYALAYIAGLLLGWRYVRHLSAMPPRIMTRAQVDSLLVWVPFGVTLGGRLGYVLFYRTGSYTGNPTDPLAGWPSGMSFNGRLVGVCPFARLWYALRYIAGLLLGWRYGRHLSALPPRIMTRDQVDDLLVWVTRGVILGGRLGYVLFYRPGYYRGNPLDALAVWHGGMSFHGGLVGFLLSPWIFSRRNGLDPLRVGDAVACATPIGLFLGRLASFVNSELWGRATDVDRKSTR